MYLRERQKLIIPFLLPALLLYIVFFAVPAAQAFPYSLVEYSGIGPIEKFVGLGNFQDLAQDSEFLSAAMNTLRYLLLSLLGLPLALLFAFILSMPLKGRRFIKSIMFAPLLLSAVVTGMIWYFIYNPTLGPLNTTLRAVGLGFLAHAWLGERATVIPALVAVALWHGIGGTIILFLAGLQKIPRDLYDAAKIDGAGNWAVFWYITFPLLWEITRLLIILGVIGGLQSFGWVLVMTRGGPAGASNVIGYYLYDIGFLRFRFGYATAIGMVMFVLVMFSTLILNRLLSKEAWKVEY